MRVVFVGNFALWRKGTLSARTLPMARELAEAGHEASLIDLASRYAPVERVGAELRNIYAASTLIVGRSGAGTVAELAALSLPSILVPLPGAEEARRNALVLQDAGAAVVIPQSSLDAPLLTREIIRHVDDAARLHEMSCNARKIAAEAPAAKLVDELLALAMRAGYPPVPIMTGVREEIRSV